MGEPEQIMMLDVAEMVAKKQEEQYIAFTDKFKAAKTTDDCYTPDAIHAAVAAFVAEEYGRDPAGFVRPFWPGGDYQAADYPAGCTVVDNPPFSILSQIVRWYKAHGVRFFLYAPALTLFSARHEDVSYLAVGAPIVYENGAEVPTSFITDLDASRIRTCPKLYAALTGISDQLRRERVKELPKYSYPDEIVTAAILQRWSKYGVDFRVRKEECVRVSALDSMKDCGKAIFGGGFLLGKRAAAERAAAERAAAERAAATRWPLSERERRIVAGMG